MAIRRFRKLRTLILVVLALGVVSYFFRSDSEVTIEPGSTLVIELEGAYIEASGGSWIANVLGESERTFSSVLTNLAVAERDERIKNVVIVIRPLQIGWGKAEELRGAIRRLQEAGRNTIAYLDMASMGGNIEYFVASSAGEVYLTPAGSLPVVGLAANYLFLGGLWEKLGVTFDVGKAGKYKSAVETYTSEEMSPASLEMANSLLDSINEIFISGIMQGRSMTREEVVAAIDRGPMLGEGLRESNLIDHVEYLDSVLSDLGGPVVEESDYSSVMPVDVGFSPVASIALIYGSGAVVQGRASQTPRGGAVFASQTAAEAIHKAATDSSFDAIILRIDSPGGSALASEHIWRSVEKARGEGKPIVASYSDVAASGGYYASVGADEIVSNAGAYTGSIGVFAIRPVLGGALSEIGIQSKALTRGRHADFLVSSEPLSERGLARLQSLVMDIYGVFLDRVAAGRDLSVEKVDEVAQGRVWTGAQAKEVGLVDRIGGLHESVAAVRERLGLDPEADVALIPFPPPRGFAEELASLFQARVDPMAAGLELLPQAFESMYDWLGEVSFEEPLAIPPFWVDMR
ncbi:MAG: signal peptide peptidase SppA [Deltaproteobacteria bacterium]|nr:signal peptide peptidase SppA [Deltaproteobacteria bacterium]